MRLGLRLERDANLGRVALVATIGLIAAPGSFAARDRASESGRATLQGFPSGCGVEMDSEPQGKTDAQCTVTLAEVETGDHYLHVNCPGQNEQEFFATIKPGENAVIKPKPPGGAPNAIAIAQAHELLTDLVRKAADARTSGHFDEAIADLRRAVDLDPANADLHRELGITFLLLKDWKAARVEYIEAIKHDPSEAESHNGLGYALEKLGDLGPAAKEYAAATHLDPDDSEYREHYFNALALLDAEKEKAKKK